MARKNDKALKIELQQAGAATVVRLHGSADMGEAEQLREVLETLAAGKTDRIVVDMSDLNFICSTGLSAIITAHLKSRHHGGQIRLMKPQPAVRELLEKTRLTKLFPISETVEQATRD